MCYNVSVILIGQDIAIGSRTSWRLCLTFAWCFTSLEITITIKITATNPIAYFMWREQRYGRPIIYSLVKDKNDYYKMNFITD